MHGYLHGPTAQAPANPHLGRVVDRTMQEGGEGGIRVGRIRSAILRASSKSSRWGPRGGADVTCTHIHNVKAGVVRARSAGGRDGGRLPVNNEHLRTYLLYNYYSYPIRRTIKQTITDGMFMM
jgi:hypothetical protein